MAAEGKIRSKVLDLDLIDAVIGLGPNLFYGTSLAACILVARRRRLPKRRGRILLVDGSDLFRRGRNQNTLEPAHISELSRLYSDFADVDGRSRVVTLDEVKAQGGNLNLAGYITKETSETSLSVADAMTSLREALEAAWAAEDRVEAFLAERGLR
jgi:type I restriction enzyme M protein